MANGNGSERSGMVQVALSDEEVQKRSAKLASEELTREGLLEKKRTHNRKWNEELRQVGTSINVLAAEVDSHQAWVPAQEQLFEAGGDDDDAEEAPTPITKARGRRGRRAAANGAEA